MLCEICKGLAVDRTPPGSDGMKINCPTCGNYAIAGDAAEPRAVFCLRRGDRYLVVPLMFQSTAFGVSGLAEGSSPGEFADAIADHIEIKVVGIE